MNNIYIESTSRRRLLLESSALIGSSAIVSIFGTPAMAQSAANPPTPVLIETLSIVFYALAPVSRLPKELYVSAATQFVKRAELVAPWKAQLLGLTSVLDAATDGKFASLSPVEQLDAIKKVQTSPSFRFFTNPAFGVFNNKTVWPLIGYEGASYQMGGYLYRGFDDINWLPK